MGVEIERKFLVAGSSWRAQVESATRIRQGYLSRDPRRTVRVRRAGDTATLTIKGPGTLTRAEFEYPIPVADADALVDTLCEPGQIDKTRHLVRHGGHVWEVDEFAGAHTGLVLAEVELPTADTPVDLPDWVGAEVTDDPAYTNANLSRPAGTAGSPLA